MMDKSVTLLCVATPSVILPGQKGMLSITITERNINSCRLLAKQRGSAQPVVLVSAVDEHPKNYHKIAVTALLEDASPPNLTVGVRAKFIVKVIGRCRLLNVAMNDQDGYVADVVILPELSIDDAEWYSLEAADLRDKIAESLQKAASIFSEFNWEVALFAAQYEGKSELVSFLKDLRELAERIPNVVGEVSADPDMPYRDYYNVVIARGLLTADAVYKRWLLEAGTVFEQLEELLAIAEELVLTARDLVKSLEPSAGKTKLPPSGKGGGELVPHQADTKTPKKFLDVILDQLNDLERRLEVVIKAGSDTEGGAK